MFGDAFEGIAEGLKVMLSIIISWSIVTLGFIGYMLHTGDVLTGKILACTAVANIPAYFMIKKLIDKFLQ